MTAKDRLAYFRKHGIFVGLLINIVGFLYADIPYVISIAWIKIRYGVGRLYRNTRFKIGMWCIKPR